MKKIVLIIVSLFLVGFFTYKYVYKNHRDIASEEVSFKFKSNELIAELMANDKEIIKYLDKVISISGIVNDLNENNLTLSNDVFCVFDGLIKDVAVGDSLIVKGRCLGFDELLVQVKLDQCQIIK